MIKKKEHAFVRNLRWDRLTAAKGYNSNGGNGEKIE
jgi:hypothetical protein